VPDCSGSVDELLIKGNFLEEESCGIVKARKLKGGLLKSEI